MRMPNLYCFMGLSLLAAACASPGRLDGGHDADLSWIRELRQVAVPTDAAPARRPQPDNAAESGWAPADVSTAFRLEGW